MLTHTQIHDVEWPRSLPFSVWMIGVTSCRLLPDSLFDVCCLLFAVCLACGKTYIRSVTLLDVNEYVCVYLDIMCIRGGLNTEYKSAAAVAVALERAGAISAIRRVSSQFGGVYRASSTKLCTPYTAVAAFYVWIRLL